MVVKKQQDEEKVFLKEREDYQLFRNRWYQLFKLGNILLILNQRYVWRSLVLILWLLIIF